MAQGQRQKKLSNRFSKIIFENKRPRIILIIILIVAAILRLWQLSKLPSGLYWDEMDVGYQAFSLLKTGKDYFGNFLPLQLHSFAEYRTPLYIYATVPFVALFGLTATAVRLPAVIFSLIGIITTYLLASKIFKSEKWAWIPALVLGVSPWYFQYSRMAFEVVSQLPIAVFGLYSFFNALDKNRKWIFVSAICFGLLPYTYSTAKLFAPMVLLTLLAFYWRQLMQFKKKYLIGATLVLFFIVFPAVTQNLEGKGNQRFLETSIFTDPTIATQINYQRELSELSSGAKKEIGLKPRLIDKVLINKPFYIIDKFTTNYLEAFSIHFLFINGDPNLRQSPAKDGLGEMYRIMSLVLLFGFTYLVVERQKLGKPVWILLIWLLLAPIPSALTRDGGSHASRLFFMVPALGFVASCGILYLFTILRGKIKVLAIILFAAIWSIEVLNFYNYYFSVYRQESAPYFNYGFDQAVKLAITQSPNYDTIIIDAHHDSALMAYLFYSKVQPSVFQKSLPLKTQQFIPNVSGNRFGNIYILAPGERSWRDYFLASIVPKGTLAIIAADALSTNEPLISQAYNQSPLLKSVIRYPNGDPDFYVIEYK